MLQLPAHLASWGRGYQKFKVGIMVRATLDVVRPAEKLKVGFSVGATLGNVLHPTPTPKLKVRFRVRATLHDVYPLGDVRPPPIGFRARATRQKPLWGILFWQKK